VVWAPEWRRRGQGLDHWRVLCYVMITKLFAFSHSSVCVTKQCDLVLAEYLLKVLNVISLMLINNVYSILLIATVNIVGHWTSDLELAAIPGKSFTRASLSSSIYWYWPRAVTL